MAALHRRCDRVRFLGSYPRAGGRNGAASGVGAPAVPEHGTDSEAFAASERRLAGVRGRGVGVRLVLARHGRTTANVAHILDSRPPGAPLDELGLEQAERLGLRLADHPVRAVYASHATRAQQTAKPVAAAHGLAVEVVDGVHEVLVGDLEGRSDDAALEAFRDCVRRVVARRPGRPAPWRGVALDLRSRYLPAVERIVAAVDGVSGDGTVDVDVVLVATAPRSGWRPPRCWATPPRPGTSPTPAWWCCVRRRAAGSWRTGTRPSRWPRTYRGRRAGLTGCIPWRVSPQPSRCRLASSIPKWWATSCTTVTAISSTSSSSFAQTSRIARGRW